MSSSSIGKPVFRLLFGYPDITLVREGSEAPLLIAAVDAPGLVAELRRCAALIAASEGGRLVVVLPSDEVWRGLPVLLARTPLGRRRAAFERAAVELGVSSASVAVTLGKRVRGGATPVAAVRASTLSEARGLLERAGLRPDAVVGAGIFPGFDAPPALALPWQMPTFAFVSRRRREIAMGASSIAAISLALALPSGRNEIQEVAVVPAPAAPMVTAEMAAEFAAQAPGGIVVLPAPAPAPLKQVLATLRASPPPARPEPIPTVARVAPGAKVTMGTRNVTFPIADARPAVAGVQVAELTPSPIRPPNLVTMPPRRPGAAPALSRAELAPILVLRPERRPRPAQQAGATPAPAAAAAPEVSAGRPMPRPGTDIAPYVVAALTPAAAIAAMPSANAAGTARIDTPPARKVAAPRPSPVLAAVKPLSAAPQTVRGTVAPAAAPVRSLAAAKPQAKATQPVRVVTVPQPQKATPRTEIVRVATPAAAKPVLVRAPEPQKKVAAVRQPAPQKVAVRAPAPQKIATRKPEPVSNRRANLRDVALIGVFAGDNGRHALVRMPNGAVQRVRAGDSVQGLQVASVGEDSINLRNGGRETTLRLPD